MLCFLIKSRGKQNSYKNESEHFANYFTNVDFDQARLYFLRQKYNSVDS